MSNSTPLVPLTAILMIAASIGAGWTGYEYNKSAKADAYYLAESSELRSAALQAIYLSERAATDSNLLSELEKLEASVEQSFGRIQNGDPINGISPAPAALQSQVSNLRGTWESISANLGKMLSSRGNTESYTRAKTETKQAIDAALADAEASLSRMSTLPASDSQEKVLTEAVESLREAASILGRDGADADVLRAAESGISSFLGSISSIGRNLPQDKQLFDSLTKAYRGAQAAQRLNIKLVDSATGAKANIPLARAIWVERDSFKAASQSLVETAKALPNTHVVSPLIVGSLGGLAVLMALFTSVLAHFAATSRAQAVESRGNSIIGSQKERSKELSILLNDINEFGRGIINHEVTDDRESTKEIAKVLNLVFGKIREIIQESDQTISGLAAASEQTLVTAQNVSRNRQEQQRALEHISSLFADMSSYVEVIQEVTSHTLNVANEVSTKVGAGSDAVAKVHEGILLIADHNVSIQHRSKNMIESFQTLGRVSSVVNQVADRSDLVAFNAHLVADQIEGNDEVAHAMNKAAEAITVLAHQCKQAVGEIDILLKNMHESARDTQYAVDSSQREIDGLLDRSAKAQSALSDISQMSTSLRESVGDVTERTQSLMAQSSEVSHTMETVLNYSAENAAASEQTAQAITNVNRSAQELQRVIQGFLKGK